MAVVITVSREHFAKTMKEEGCTFTWEALDYLYDYYDGYDENIEFDSIDLMSNWHEYTEVEELIAQYSHMLTEAERLRIDNADLESEIDREGVTEMFVEKLRKYSTVAELTGGSVLVEIF